MISDYFQSVKEEIEKLEWLIVRSSVESEYDEDINIGMLGGYLYI